MLTTFSLLCALSLSMPAAAGHIYINDVQVDGLRNQDFQKVDVRIDANGDIYIEAKNYTIKLLEPADGSTATPPPEQAVAAVEPGLYWLVSEDNESIGHAVEVYVNNILVRTVRSGDAQVVVDLAPYLKRGKNIIKMNALPGPQPQGGSMHVYVGPGENRDGVIYMDDPPVDFARRSSDNGSGANETFTMEIH